MNKAINKIDKSGGLTSALHAEGREFEPRRNLSILLIQTLKPLLF